MKLCLIGGHLSPAVRVMQEAQKRGDSGIFIGRSISSLDASTPSQEAFESSRLGFEFFTIPQAKLNRFNYLSNFSLPLKFLSALVQSLHILSAHKPQVVISFGGYLALPVVIAAKWLRIPCLTHEQTTEAGLSNRLIGRFCRIIAVSYQSSQKYFPSNKTIITGNLIRKEFEINQLPTPDWFNSTLTKPILYITGGNQGSVTINQTLWQLLPQLTANFCIIHQCGGSQTQQSFVTAQNELHKLPPSNQSRYIVKPWFDALSVAWIMSRATAIISRSGANTIHEIIHSALPAILIPLPHAQKQEQLKNAQIITSVQAGILLLQSHLTASSLNSSIQTLFRRIQAYKNAAASLKRQYGHPEAPQQFYQLIDQLVNKNTSSKTIKYNS